jgi:hypothetical protein
MPMLFEKNSRVLILDDPRSCPSFDGMHRSIECGKVTRHLPPCFDRASVFNLKHETLKNQHPSNCDFSIGDDTPYIKTMIPVERNEIVLVKDPQSGDFC